MAALTPAGWRGQIPDRGGDNIRVLNAPDTAHAPPDEGPAAWQDIDGKLFPGRVATRS